MITRTGKTIPDPPSDPNDRRVWKMVHFADLYGNTKEEVEQYMSGMNDGQLKSESRVHFTTYLAIAVITGSVLLTVMVVVSAFAAMWR